MDVLKVLPWPRTPLQAQSDDFWAKQLRDAGLVLVVDAQGRAWHVRPDSLKGDKQ